MPKNKTDAEIVAQNKLLADRLLALLVSNNRMYNEWEANAALGRDVLHPLPLFVMEKLHSEKRIFLISIDGVYRLKIRRNGDKESDKNALRKVSEL